MEYINKEISMNEEEKNITTPVPPAETAAPAPKRRGRPRKNPIPAENGELPLENTKTPAETEIKTAEKNSKKISSNCKSCNGVAWAIHL
jgi:hypothetical protein